MDITKREKIGLSVFLFVMIMVIAWTYFKNTGNKDIEVNSKNAENSTASKSEIKKIKVYICGEVKKFGVYEVNEGDRLIELIEKAGGLTEKADEFAINLSLKLKDEDFIRIPEKVSAAPPNATGTSVPGVPKSTLNRININTATKDQLNSLPGIGDVLAQKIIDYRDSKGSFKSIEDLKNVNGIGESRFNEIKDKITVH